MQRVATGRDGVEIAYATFSTDVHAMRRHGVEPIVLEGVGHLPMIEAPDRFDPVLASFVERAGGGQSSRARCCAASAARERTPSLR